MKKLTLTLMCALALAACGGETAPPPATEQKPASQPATASAPAKTESYIVGTDIGYPPFDFRDDKGQIVGFDMDILKAIADDQGFSVSFTFAPKRSDLFPNLAANQYQILAACLGVNPERQASAELSVPYAQAPNAIMSRADKKAVSLADLANGKVAVQKDSYSHDVMKKVANKGLVTTNSLFDAYKAFAGGQADYVIGDAGALNYYNKNHQQQDAKAAATNLSVYDPSEDTRIVFAVQKGNTELINKINAGLKNIRANKTYDQIYKKWFGDDESLKVPEQ